MLVVGKRHQEEEETSGAAPPHRPRRTGASLSRPALGRSAACPRPVRSWCTAPGTPVWPGCARPGRPLGRRGASLLPAAVPGPGSPTSAPRPSGPGCWGTRALGEHPWPGERRDRLRASPGPGRVGHGTACPRLRPALVAPGCAPRSPRAAGLPGPRRCQRRTTRSLHPKRKKIGQAAPTGHADARELGCWHARKSPGRWHSGDRCAWVPRHPRQTLHSCATPSGPPARQRPGAAARRPQGAGEFGRVII